MKRLKIFTFLLIGGLLAFSACKKTSTPTPAPKPGVMLSTNSTLGNILVDEKGMTLYFFSKDANGQSACTEGCLANWPVFYAANLEIGSGLDQADFAVITRSDGKAQITYKGWPLYYFANDNAAGDVNGEGVKNVWYVAKPDYSVMLAAGQLVGADGKNYRSDYTEGTETTLYLTDAMGRTLYTFKKDSTNNNNFTKPDFSNNSVWPIAEITPDKVPTGFNANDFGQIDVFGKKQLTYKGWPLYYFGQDTKRGETKGVSFPAPGVWPIANASTPAAPMPVTANDGNAY